MLTLVVDDERTFEELPFQPQPQLPRFCLYARNSKEAINILTGMEVDVLFLDHDLGGDDTSMKVVDHLLMNVEPNLAIYVHSMNPVGAENIIRALQQNYYVRRVSLPKCI